ncbi:Zinc finger protein [Fasciolopsis buskii]|uniref:Zinc finger protein n=1 Tax=Fasciolopsis buskii TaxID=27845 RepID=A0A8E0RVF3_9TREM|nr:Zinc finger protein [Fasciolopsis buski]
MPRFKSTPRSILGFQPDSGLSNPPDLTKALVKRSEALVEITSGDLTTKSNMGSVSDNSIPARHSEPIPVSSVNDAECLGSLHVAALFAQAAALLTMHTDRTFPVGSTYNPPIAPLGLSFFGFPNPIINGQELPKLPNPADGLSFTSVASNKGSALLPGSGLFSRRSRPRIGHRADPSNSARFPCWLPMNSSHARTKLRLLAESENLNLKNLSTSRKHRANPVRPSKSKEKLAKQSPQMGKSAPLPASSLPSPSVTEVPGPSTLDERQSEPPSLVQSSTVLSSHTTTSREKPSSMVASSQDVRQLSPVRHTPVSKPSPPYPLLSVEKQTPPDDSQTKNSKQNYSSVESIPSKDKSLSTSLFFSTPSRRTRSAVARESNGKKPVPKPPPDMESSRSPKKPLGFVECKICHKSLRQSSMNEHLARHDNSGKYKCTTCGVTFSRRSAQEKHERIHTGEKPFKCEHCPKAYRQMAHLRDHLRSHSGERPFVCRLCGFASGYKSLLRRHLRTHGVSKHPNAVPDLWYKTSGTKEEVLAVASEIGRKLESGQALILGESGRKLNPSERSDIELARHHLCCECPAGFPTFQALRSHQITAHGLIRKHRCKLCGEEFASTGLRRQHSKQVHPLVSSKSSVRLYLKTC